MPTDGAPMGVVSLGEAEAYSTDNGGVFASGDQDGDGCTDFAFATTGNGFDEVRGTTHIFRSPVLGEFDAHGDWAGPLEGEPGDNAYRIASGDVNGDGLADWIVGGFGIRDDLGGVYVAYGPVTESMELATEADAFFLGSGEFRGGEDHEAVDLDGDGYDEMIIGAPSYTVDDEHSGAVYVISGPVSGDKQLSDVDTVIAVGQHSVSLGFATTAGGDVSGDGLVDLVLGSGYFDDHGGGVWVFETPFSGKLTIDDADATLTASSSGGDQLEPHGRHREALQGWGLWRACQAGSGP